MGCIVSIGTGRSVDGCIVSIGIGRSVDGLHS